MRWAILALMFGVGFLAYVLRLNISVAAKFMMDDLHLTGIEMGWIFSSFTLAYALFQFPGGVFGEWLGSRRAVTVIILAWGLLTILTGWLPGLPILSGAGVLVTLIAVRFLMGAAQAPIFPIEGAVVEAWFPRSGWAFPNGLVSTGLALGGAATPPLVAWLMLRLGWRQSFYWLAPATLLFAAVWHWYVRDRPADHRGVNDAERSLIGAERPPAVETRPVGRALRAVITNRNVLLLGLSYLCMNYVFYIFFSWFYIYLVDVRRFSILEGGVFAALPWITGALCASLGGLTCDRLCRRFGPRWGCRLPGALSLLLVGGFLFAGASAQSPYAAVACLSICFGFTQFTEGAYWAGTAFVAGPHTAAAGGILNTGGNIGGVISTPLIPVIVAQLGWLPALATGSLFAFLGAALWLLIEVDRPLDAGC